MSERAPSITGLKVVAVDCAEPLVLADFWQSVLGGEIEPQGDGDATLRLPDSRLIDFLRVPEGKTIKNRLHFDVDSSDFDQAIAEVLALGATNADDVYDGRSWQVLRDPEGNEFCILKPRSH